MSIVKLCRLCHDDGEVVHIVSWILVDRLKLLVHRVLLQAWAFENKTTFFSDFAKWVILCFTSVKGNFPTPRYVYIINPQIAIVSSNYIVCVFL